jgi:phenylalanyl-tRNA synthetase beta chain
LVDKDIPVVKIEKIIKETIPEIWLTSFHVFDVYQDEKLPPGKKSIAVAMILQDDQRTLVDSEINSLIDVILKKLLENLAITLRE